jgi:hypothetical protein
MRLKKYVSIFGLGCLLVLGSSGLTKAADENIGFSFKIGSWHKNGRIADNKARERSTTNPDNQWKVRLKSTGEGAGTISTFWLELYSERNVSPNINATQGYTVYYKSAYLNASRTWVYLTGQNNNFNSDSYYVSGIWDEETQKIAK